VLFSANHLMPLQNFVTKVLLGAQLMSGPSFDFLLKLSFWFYLQMCSNFVGSFAPSISAICTMPCKNQQGLG
jgi:hypothetical protein